MKRIIFMGTPDFSRTVLQGLIDSEYEVIAAVTQPDRPVGRKRILTASSVKKLAQDHDIPVYQPEKISGSPEADILKDLNADLIVTAAYGQFVPTSLIEAPTYKAINVHASLLPKYRGGAPIHYAILEGESETGISLIYMTKKMDAGDILAQRAIPIESTDDVGNMFLKLADLGRDILLETLPDLFEGTVETWPQIEEKVTFSPTIKKEQEQLDWNQTANQIDNHIRAFRPFPTTYTWLDDKRTKIWQGHPVELSLKNEATNGTIVGIQDQKMIVQCGQNTFYAIEEWQESGKKRMPVANFLNGTSESDIIGQQFQVK